MSAPSHHSLDPGSKNRLTPRLAHHFTGDTLFDAIARAVCEAECLPRKELYEAWEVARRVRRRFRGGPVVDVPAGHGLLAWILLILDDTSPTARCIDRRRPSSSARLDAVLAERWPRLAGRVQYTEQTLAEAQAAPGSLIVSIHACGTLTDRVLDLALASCSRVAVLPCCHDLERCETDDLQGWLDGPVAVDVARAERLRREGYRVRTQRIPEAITPHNRLLLGEPPG